MNIEIKKYLDDNGWKYKEVVNNQYCVETCPICEDNRNKFYINSINGCWDCKLCGASGNFYQLKAQLGELNEISATNNIFSNKKEISFDVLTEYINNLKNNKEAYNYLKSRGFSDESITNFKLGCDGNYIVIPHIENGKFWNAKFRNFREKGFKRISGQPSLLFNYDNIDKTKKAIVIVESETDCIAATQMGIKNVVALTTGASAFPPEWIPYVAPFKDIYICLNSDLPGQKGAKSLIEKLGVARCKNVILPIKDVNEYLLHKEEYEPFYKYVLKKAEKGKLGNISSISDYIENLDSWFDSEGSLSGMRLPYTKLNAHLNGFKEEDLIILSGQSGIGKTSWVLNTINEFLKNGQKCLCYFLEGKIMFYILRMMCIESGKKIDDLRSDPEEWENIKRQFASYQLYFYSGAQADINTKKIIELSDASVKIHNINFIAIDNLQKFVADINYVVQNTSDAISQLKNLAVDIKIPVLLISHVRKPSGTSPRVTMYDAKSSSTIYQNADVYLIIWNNKRQGATEDNIILSIEKNRMGEGGIDIKMNFDKTIARFTEKVELDSIPIKRVEDKGHKAITKELENDSF